MLTIDNISFAYNQRQIFQNLNFSVDQGQHLCLMGESGCGKSTLLKLIYGKYSPEKGSISNDGEPILGPENQLIPGMDYMKYVAQDFDLMAFETVGENIGKFLSNTDRVAKAERVDELLQIIDMGQFASQKVVKLSGGQQQRVAIAKALAKEPTILLLDEPFSQIDRLHKTPFAKNLFRHCKKNNITVIVATHDSKDAMAFSDKIIVLRDGEIVQSGTPEEIFQNPKDLYVAGLLDTPNLFENGKINFPHQLKISDKGLKANVLANYFQGDHYLIDVKVDDKVYTFKNDSKFDVGSKVYLAIDS